VAKIYAGTSGWAYATWKPDFYPAKLASAKFLGHYSSRLNTVEVKTPSDISPRRSFYAVDGSNTANLNSR
jgi:uncharacterized protein YecE (DUF72 family)